MSKQKGLIVGVILVAIILMAIGYATLGLDTKGESAYAILEIENGSQGIDAKSVKVTTDGTDTTILDFKAVMCDEDGQEITGDNPVASQAKTYVKVSVTLLQTPTTDITNAETTITVTATPKDNV